MGRRNRNNRRQFKKSTQEIKNYQDFINQSSYTPDSTLPVTNEFLQGSAEIKSYNEELNTSFEVKKTPLKYRLSDWIKNNIFPTVITTIVIAIGTATISHLVNIALINQKIEYIEKQVQQLEIDSVKKETLNSKLNELELKINSSYSLKLNDIEWELKKLEKEVDDLSQ